MAKVEITTGPEGGRIVVDGHDIGKGVARFTLDSRPRSNRLQLDVIAHEIEVNGEAQIHIAPAARELLINLGWTPPGEVRTAACCAKAPDRHLCAPASGGEAL